MDVTSDMDPQPAHARGAVAGGQPIGASNVTSSPGGVAIEGDVQVVNSGACHIRSFTSRKLERTECSETESLISSQLRTQHCAHLRRQTAGERLIGCGGAGGPPRCRTVARRAVRDRAVRLAGGPAYRRRRLPGTRRGESRQRVRLGRRVAQGVQTSPSVREYRTLSSARHSSA
jgi:hypothetical protein